jgi:hypothetical protein
MRGMREWEKESDALPRVDSKGTGAVCEGARGECGREESVRVSE